MEYTVKKLAQIAGISVRTLHYYDEIGLLKPSFIKENGYRYYAEKELLLLQQILFFRELEFPLEQIISIMKSPSFDRLNALEDQKILLEAKKKRLAGLVATIEKTIRSEKGGENMSASDMYGNFTKDELDKLQEEARQRWGHTDAWKQSQERTKHWKKEDYDRIAKEGETWTKKMAEMMRSGLKPEDREIQEMIDQHYNGLKTFYEPNYEMYKGLGDMYVSDPRFTAFYERFGEGLAVFMRDAMTIYADGHLNK